MLWEVFALIGNYPPKIDGVDKSRDRTAGVSWRERYGVPKSNVMKEEMQRGGVFEERIKELLYNMSGWFIHRHPRHRGRRARRWDSRANEGA